jgi:WD40 repeat protein
MKTTLIGQDICLNNKILLLPRPHQEKSIFLIPVALIQIKLLLFSDYKDIEKKGRIIIISTNFCIKIDSFLRYGLSWNTMKRGYLASGSFDNKINIWDIESGQPSQPIFGN